MSKKSKKGIYPAIKRGLDVTLSLLAMVLLLPVFLIVAILVKCDGGPIFYAQTRVGRNGKPFRVYKFRSMKPGAERLEDFLTPEELAEYRKEYKLLHDPRVSPIGMHLRRSSLDELPELPDSQEGNQMTLKLEAAVAALRDDADASDDPREAAADQA